MSYTCNSLGEDIANSLIGLHCFIGCDSCSAFKLKGKVKALNLMKSSASYINAFQQLGVDCDINSQLVFTLEKFVCSLYGQETCECVNDARYAIFKLKYRTDMVLPPNL